MKKICSLFVTVAILICIIVTACAETWYCPNCGRKNDSNFCPADGTRKPSNVSTETRTLSDLPVLSSTQTKLVASENVAVYTGPGTEYYRSASGKANVHHSATVKAYGRDGDWVLIQYDATRKGESITRFAYAPVNLVANGRSLQELDFEGVSITISSGAHIVDEPSMSHHFTDFSNIEYGNAVALAKINAGGTTWIYFETYATSGQGYTPFRGFVRIKDVTEQ